PKAALSDAEQQLTPKALDDLLNDLIVRVPTTKNVEFKTQLDELRRAIDDLDEEITQKLSSRMEIAEKIGEYKKENNVTILQVKRWEEVITARLSTAKAMGLSEEFMRGVLKLVHKESIRRQTEVMNKQVQD
ncbi:MAG: bifunctional 3-deoxy-7-phosphoheptulonate synthase/chorismate mutase type II, partial [Flavobacteriales bacterium]|nr:bifunctional 3-deoxy-7-phosphoheptulonate synthase/chorismate mutase type II [Flavobacteriales bacterium]